MSLISNILAKIFNFNTIFVKTYIKTHLPSINNKNQFLRKHKDGINGFRKIFCYRQISAILGAIESHLFHHEEEGKFLHSGIDNVKLFNSSKLVLINFLF